MGMLLFGQGAACLCLALRGQVELMGTGCADELFIWKKGDFARGTELACRLVYSNVGLELSEFTYLILCSAVQKNEVCSELSAAT